MEQLAQALGEDLCAGIVNQSQARSILLEAMNPVRLANAISGAEGFSSSCRSAQASCDQRTGDLHAYQNSKPNAFGIAARPADL